jgi:hypothetical protein
MGMGTSRCRYRSGAVRHPGGLRSPLLDAFHGRDMRVIPPKREQWVPLVEVLTYIGLGVAVGWLVLIMVLIFIYM